VKQIVTTLLGITIASVRSGNSEMEQG